MTTYYNPTKKGNFIQVLNKNPLFSIDSQDYKAIIDIINKELYFKTIEKPRFFENYKFDKKSFLIPKNIFNNEIFIGTEFENIFSNPKKLNIEARKPQLYIRLNEQLTKNKFKYLKAVSVSVKYPGMYGPSSFIGNRVGIPILKMEKILKPDTETETKMLKHFKKLTKHPHRGFLIYDIFDLMVDFPQSVVYYKHARGNIYYKYLPIVDILDKFYKPLLEKLISNFRHTEKNDKYVFANNSVFLKTEIEVNLNEIMNIIIGKEFADFKKLQQLARTVSKTSIISEVKNIKNLNAELYPHQQQGVSWLYGLYFKKLSGAILADDMGMGKTIQTIAFLTILQNKKQLVSAVVVCPASVISVWEKEIKQFNIKLLKYVQIYSFEKFINIKLSKTPDVLIIDEAQRAKNKQTGINKRLQTVNAKFTILLSGTPIENKTEDLFNILSIIDKIFFQIFKVLSKFSQKDENILAEKAAQLISAIYLRRMKSTKELKSVLTIEEVYIPMVSQEKIIHKNITKFYNSKKIRKNATTNFEYYNDFIIGLMRLRQTCSYSYQLKDLPFAPKNMQKISSKAEKLKKLVLSKKDEKFVIFTSFTETTKFLKNELPGKTLVIDGSVSSSLRGSIIKSFQDDDSVKYIIVSLKAGNSGITLHSAKNIVIFDLWWNPAILQQAIARVHRIGQQHDVNAYLFVNKDSFDENILRIINLKKDIYDAFEGKSSQKISDKNTIDKLIDMTF